MGLQCAGTAARPMAVPPSGLCSTCKTARASASASSASPYKRPSVPFASIEGIPPTALATQGRPSSMASPKLLGLFSQPDGSKKTSASKYACRMAAASSGPV